MSKIYNKNNRFRKNEIDKNPAGHLIRAKEVNYIDESGARVLPLGVAIAKAEGLGLDLVQISGGDIPTCKSMDYSRFKYERDKREKLQKKKQRENAVKLREIKLRPSTGYNDLKIKAAKIDEFLSEGDKVKISVVFRGRELAYKDSGEKVIDDILSFLTLPYLSESKPAFFGRSLSLVISKSSSKPVSK